MSVCSQMGNGHSKGGKKKKKDLVKEGTGLVDDPPSEQPELENGDLQQEGLKLFYKDRSRRRDVTKDLAKQHGTTSRDCGDGELNGSSQGDGKNVGDTNHVSPNETLQGNVRCTLQDGEDPVGAFGDSSLVSDHVTGNKSDKVCGDIMAGEHNQTTADPVLVKSGMSSGDATGDASVTSDNVPVDVTSNVAVNSPGIVAVGIHGDVSSSAPYVPINIPGDASSNVPFEGPGNVPDDIPVLTVLAPINIPGDAPTNVPFEGPGNVRDDVPVPSGLVLNHASRPVQAQQKKPTTGDDTSSDQEQTRSGKAPPQEQNEYISPNQSIPPTPPSKIESSSPSPMQIVSGVIHTKSAKDDDAENLKVTDQLISEVVIDNSLFLEKLSKYLDRESRVIKCWKHLAYVLDVPPEERNQFDVYTEHSPTEDLFNFLSDIWNPDLTVEGLKGKLKLIHRNDVIADIEKGGFKDVMKVGDLISGQPKFIELLSPKLDKESRTIGNWRSLATEFGIRKQKTEQFGLRGSGPTGALFLHMRTAEGLHDLTMEQLRTHFQEMERKDLVNLLDKQGIEGSWLVKNVLVDGSELLADIGERLNKEIRAVKNWRNLAYRLKIPPEIYSAFDTSKEMAKSPTKMMFQWLAKWKPDLNIGDLLKSIKAIDRFDVVEIVTKEAEAALEKLKKDKEASKQQCAFLDGATEQPSANQVLHDLQQMRQDADKRSGKTLNFYSDLKKNAYDKGFIVSDNPGQGDCMFYALSEQLELVKGIKYSAAELRRELVQYLQQHPKLPDGTDLFNFTPGYTSWTAYLDKMAEDGTWGDHVILLAAANHFNTPIRVISSLPGHEDIIINPQPPFCHGADTLVLGHVHEEHYVSLPPLSVLSGEGFSRGNSQVLQRNGQHGQYLHNTRYGEPPFTEQRDQQPQGYQQRQFYQQRQREQPQQAYYQSQDNQQMQDYQQRLRDQELQQRKGNQQLQERRQRQGYPHHHSVQQLHGQRPPLSRDHRIEMKVKYLPLVVYSKICVKLNIKRDVFFDDFRMLAEELGMDRDLITYIGQQKNPTDFIFSEYSPNVIVGELVKILHKIERLDVAAVLENWIEQGST